MADIDNDSGGYNCKNYHQESCPREQDRFLPIANVGRIMKKALPSNAKISKDAKEIVQECVSEFISFITGEASDKCLREKRKTINGDDLIWSMTTLGFEDYVDPLKIYLQRFRDMEGEKGGGGGGGGGSGGGGGRQEKEGGNGNGNVVTMVNNGVGFVGDGSAGVYDITTGIGYEQPSHQGHVYGDPGVVYSQMGLGGSSANSGSGYIGSGPSSASGRPR